MSRPRYSFLVCPDPQLIKGQIARMLEQSGQSGWEERVYWGDDDDPLPPAFWQDLTIKSLFPQPKALIVRRAHSFKVDQWDKLNDAMGSVSDEIWPIYCLEGQWKTKKAPVPVALTRRDFFKTAKKSGWVWEMPGLNIGSLRDFVGNWAAENQLQLAPGALDALVQALPTDAVAARLELDKLELAAGDERTITREHTQLIPEAGEMEFFTLMDALGQRGAEAGVWKRVLADHLKKSGDKMVFNLIGYLASQARAYWMLQSGEDSKVKLPPFVKQKKGPVARRLGPRGIAKMIDLALDAEMSIKTGARTPEDTLDILIAGLITLFQTGR